jgi:phosphatidylcholine synthase
MGRSSTWTAIAAGSRYPEVRARTSCRAFKRRRSRSRTVRFLFSRYFLVHLWTLSGLALSMGGLFALFSGREALAARLIFFPIAIDFTDGTLARKFRVKEKIPLVSGEALDMITDVISLTFVPLVFFWRTGVFLPVYGTALCVIGIMTCSLKYSMKEQVLRQGYSIGSTPIFFSIFLFYFLDLDPVWPTLYTAVLILLILSPIRYPITSLVTTHWKFGWKSVTNYATFLSFVPLMIWLQDTWRPLLWALLVMILVQLYVYPVLMFAGILKPGFDRTR